MAAEEYPNLWTPSTTSNINIKPLVEKFDRAVSNILQSESAELENISGFDLGRMQSWSSQIREQTDLIYSAGPLDLPYVGPVLPYDFQTQDIDLQSIKCIDLRTLAIEFTAGWTHWSRSTSSKKTNGFEEADYQRAIAILDRIDAILSHHVAAGPEDHPKTGEYRDASTGE